MSGDGGAGGSVSSAGGFSTLLHRDSSHSVASVAFDFLNLSEVLSSVSIHASGGLNACGIVTALMKSQR